MEGSRGIVRARDDPALVPLGRLSVSALATQTNSLLRESSSHLFWKHLLSVSVCRERGWGGGGLGGGVWKGGWRSRPPARAVTVGAGGEGCGLSRPRPLHENGKEQRGTAGRLAEGAQLRSPGARAVTPAALPLGRARRAPGGRPARRRLRTAPGRPPRVPGRPYACVTTAACLVTGRPTRGSYLQKAASLRELPEAAASHRRAVSATPEPRHAGCLCGAQSAVSVGLWTAWHPGPQRQAGTTSHGPAAEGSG